MRTLLCLMLTACSFDGAKTSEVDGGTDASGVTSDAGGDARAGDASTSNVDPVGTWHVMLTYATNNCGESVSPETIVVTAGHTTTLDGVQGVGAITCDPSHCAFDEAFTFVASGSSSKLSLQLSLAPNGSITGSGSLASMPPYCLATLTAQGTRS